MVTMVTKKIEKRLNEQSQKDEKSDQMNGHKKVRKEI
jgi:hypothetical protein